jgi:hypothetical protein
MAKNVEKAGSGEVRASRKPGVKNAVVKKAGYGEGRESR